MFSIVFVIVLSLDFGHSGNNNCNYSFFNNLIESSRGSFAQPSYGVQGQHRIYLLIGQELVFEHEYAGGMRHMR